MPKYEITAPDGKTLVIESPRPPTQEDAKKLFEQYSVQQERTLGDKVGGAIEAGASMVSSAIAKPVAGFVGLANLAVTQNPSNAAKRVEQVEQALTYQPNAIGQEYLQAVSSAPIISDIAESMQRGSEYAGQATLDATSSPLAASLAQAAPEAIAAGLSAFVPGGIAARQATKAEGVAQAGAGSAVRGTSLEESQLAKSPTADTLKSGKIRDIAEIINADPKFYQALDDLGVTAEPLASYASRNPQFRGIEQSFAALPSSPQNAQALEFMKGVSGAAQGLMEKYTDATGSVDASLKWRDASTKVIDELGDAADVAYDALDEVLDKRAVAEPVKTTEFLNDFTKNLALGIDDPDVPAVIKQAYRSLQPRQVVTEAGVQQVPATLENMDRLRKNIGAAAFRKEGDFKDADSALLKRIYANLTDDINSMAEAQGLTQQVQAAKSLVSQRKRLEEDIQNLLGKNLTKDVVPVIQQGIAGLAKGGAQRYQTLMKSIPDAETRQQLVFTALNDQFTKTLKGEKGTFDTTGFLKWYDKTLGQESVRKIIGKDLPEGALKDLDNMATIARGVAQATAQKIPTGVVNSVLNDQGGFLSRMVGTAGKAARAVPGGGIVADTVSAIVEVMSKSGTRAEKTSELLADPRLQQIIKRGVAQGVAQGKKTAEANRLAEKRLSQSANYQAWVKELTESERAKLASVGLTQFLLAGNGNDN
jgi:hypothetical protein